jgi:DNA polymerase-4
MEGTSKRPKSDAGESPFGRRVFCHLDCNCFYASVEQARLFPALEGLPVAVRQRNLIVTSNYVCRAMNVPKMCSVDECKRICPTVVVIESDMSRYREASRNLLQLLRDDVGVQPERASIDEVYIDLTELTAREPMPTLCGDHVVIFGGTQLCEVDSEDLLLARAATVAERIRLLIKERLRLDTSAGVSFNRSFSKFASGLNKPMKTTVVPLRTHDQLLRMKPTIFSGVGPAMWESLLEICEKRLDSFTPRNVA